MQLYWTAYSLDVLTDMLEAHFQPGFTDWFTHQLCYTAFTGPLAEPFISAAPLC